MAVYSNKTHKIKSLNKDVEKEKRKVGQIITYSGIYECDCCGFTITMNKHQSTLPPHECGCTNNHYVAFALSHNPK